MKLFKRIYYIALGLALILIFSFTVADVQGGKGRGDFDVDEAVGYLTDIEYAVGKSPHSLLDTNAHNTVANTIKSKLESFKLEYAEGVNADTAEKPTSAADNTVTFKEGKPSFCIQKLSYTLDDYYKELGITEYTENDKNDEGDKVSLEIAEAAFPLDHLRNIYAAFPGTSANAKTVVLMAHYDSVPMGSGASDDLSSVSAMLAVINDMVKSKRTYQNNIVFVFTDGEEFGLYGAKMAKKFAGFGGAMLNAGFIANFDSRGTAGTSIMFETNTNNYEVIKQYAKISNSIYTNSIANFIYSVMPNYTDFSVFKTDDTSVPGLNFANLGQGENYHTQNDNLARATSGAGRAFISQHGDIMGRIVDHFGKLDLTKLTASGNAVFFSYLGAMVIYYPIIVAFILGGLILGLILAVIAANRKKKAFSWKSAGLGAAAQGIALACTVGLIYGIYYLIGLLAALFGKIDIHYISSIRFSSPALLIGALAFTAIITAGVYTVFKKVFKIKAGDVVNGSILVLCAVAAVLSFVLPEASFLFAWVAVLEAVVMLVTVLLKDKFKEKAGFAMERLFLPLVPVILCLPMTLSILMLAGDALGAYMYPFICAVAVFTLGMIAPYFSYLKPAMQKVFDKIPPITFKQLAPKESQKKEPVKQAKAGKDVSRYKGNKAVASKEDGESKYISVKQPWRYTNGGALGFLAFIVFIFVLCFSMIGGNIATAAGGSYGANSGAFKANALIYVMDKPAGSNYWMVADLDAYKHMRDELTDYKWDKDKEAYVKTDGNNFFSGSQYNYENITKERSNTYKIIPAFSNVANVIKRYTVTIDNTGRALSSVTVQSASQSTYKITVDAADKDKVILKLTGMVNITFNTKSGEYAGTFTYEEEMAGLYDREFEDVREDQLDYGENKEYNEWKAVKDMGSKQGLKFKLAVKFIRTYTCG